MTKSKCIAFAIAAALFLISGVASAQSISIVSGNGQLGCEACPTRPITSFDNLVVLVKNAAGSPLQGATVNWAFTSIQSAAANIPAQTITDANGMTNIPFFLQVNTAQLFAVSYAQGQVSATIAALPSGTPGTTGQSVIFTETDALTDTQATGNGNGIVEVSDTVLAPLSGVAITGPAGSTLAAAIQIRVVGSIGAQVGIPGVAVLVQPPASGPSITCAAAPGGQPNVAITDSTGTATCNVVFGAIQGNGQAQVVVGQADNPFDSRLISFTTTQGVPGGVTICQSGCGNNQTGNAGAQLPSPLTATVVDQAGNPLNGINVNWAVATGTATLSNVRNTSDANGKVSANLTLGSNPGTVTVTVSIAGSPNITPGTFTETVNISITGMQIISGGNQSAIVGQAFPAPLVVQVNNGAQPVQGVTVNFAVTSGSATINGSSSGTAQTNAQGQAQISVTAGQTTGNVVVSATVNNGFTQIFNLTVIPPGPSITTSSFYNAASLVSGAISPCSLATIIATGLAPGLQGALQPPLIGLLPVLVYNDSVLFTQGNINAYAPIWDVANVNGQEQMTIEVPCELGPGSVNVTVTVGTGSKAVTLNLPSASPGIFQTQGSDRKLRAVVQRQDGSYAAKENPARPNETVYMFVTGLGPVNPQIGTNQIGIPGTISNVPDLTTIVVGVNNAGVQVVSAAYAPDLVGIYVIGFVIPPDAPSGDLPLAVAVSQAGNLVFGNGSLIPVQQ